MRDALARKATIDQIVGAFEKCEARVRAAFAEIAAAEHDINAELSIEDRYTRGAIRVDASSYGYHDDFTAADRAVERMARDCWRHLVERLELHRMLSVARANELERRLNNEHEKLPPITRETVAEFVGFYLDHLPDMLRESVLEVFDMLRPRDWTETGKLKTNRHDGEVPRRVIMAGIVEPHFMSHEKIRVRYGHAQAELVALQNVFSALDGKGSILKTYQSPLETALNEQPAGALVETEFFKARGYLNGRLHLEFRRLDLLKKLNQIAGGKNLKSGEAA